MSSSTPARACARRSPSWPPSGVRAVVLFGVPARKDAVGSGASDPDGIVQLALADLRGDLGDDVVLIADLCVDEYTDHGHCGVLDEHGDVDNDRTLEIYAAAALAQARAGAHVVAPSGMMDGQVGHIRAALDGDGFSGVSILAYSAKYASGLYGPFRDAVDVTIVGGGDRKGYQQDWRNAREALREIDADVAQGADMVMVKPALAYLDVIRAARERVDVPVAAYHVSGEYAMIKAAAANGWIDGDIVAVEHLTAIKRAGADVILTYFARWFAEAAGGASVTSGADRGLRPGLRGCRVRPGGVRRARAPVERRDVGALDAGDPRRRQLVDPGLQGGGRSAVRRRPRRGAVRVGRRGNAVHRPRPELRRGHPRPRPPGDHRGRSPRPPRTARPSGRRRRGR